MRESVFNLLKNLRGLDSLRRLFIAELNYERANQPISKRNWPLAASDSLTNDPTIIAEHGDFKIIYLQQDSELLHMGQRSAINELLKSYPYALFVFSNADQDQWHFVNVKYDPDNAKRRLFRRIVVGYTERLRTASERLSMIDLATLNPSLFGIDPLAIQQRHDAAFDVEAITRVFFDDYRKQFDRIKYVLQSYSNDQESAHSYALQFINRLMFVYFVQRKGWLNNDHEFLKFFWDTYKNNKQTENTFIEEWLNVLFFESFNNKFFPRPYLPAKINEILQLAPYLNGGLFRRNQLDEAYAGFHLSDADFVPLFDMLQRYNFTIREDGPLDQQVSVDPEMIGKVYESLVNVTTEANERGDIGIFYTPRTEIDLMCRLTLVDYLSQRLGQRDLIYQFVFALEANEQQHIDQELIPQALWEELGKALNEVKVIDPACGSGSFLVGMLNVLDQLIKRANNQPDVNESERKRKIIQESLYGVDIMDWAVDITELRLWLQLVVETQYDLEDLRFHPLLPDLSFKIRQGDSLVQEVAGINFAQIRTTGFSNEIQDKIDALQKEKLKVYRNEDVNNRNYKTNTELKQAELIIINDLFRERKKILKLQIQQLLAKQASLLADDKLPKENQNRLNLLELELDETIKAANSLKTIRDVPFIWDMAFVEIFHGSRKGFDIVIGNPPYVRQERIGEHIIKNGRLSGPKSKNDYKNKLIESVYKLYVSYFGWDRKKNKPSRKLNKKSDLYIYFFFHGLSLLNEQGCLGFVTSNSWLDVGYGADLQEFLLLQGHVRLMLDNKTRRTFANADVNSTIAILGAPQVKPQAGLANTARFVQFAVPFEAAFDSKLWQLIDHTSERTTTAQLRVMPVAQQTLHTEGFTVTDDDTDQQIKPNGYAGSKWGGKYLRAPDIYYRLMENPNLFIEFSKVAKRIRRNNLPDSHNIKSLKKSDGFTGYNFLHSVKDVSTIKIDPDKLPKVLELSSFDKKNMFIPDIISNRFIGNKFCFFEGGDFFVNDSFFVAEIDDMYNKEIIKCLMNSTISFLMLEIFGRKNMGEGVLCIYGLELNKHLIINPEFINEKDKNTLLENYRLMSKRVIKPIYEEIQYEDRKNIDNVVFEILGLSEEEKADIYSSLISLVDDRNKKAASFNAVQGLFERYANDEDITK